MELHVLVDNNTLIDQYYLAEPGFSEGKKVLFDTGYSDVFLKNSQKMGVDLSHLDYVALSHSHLDHTWGLEPLIRYYSELKMARLPYSKPTLVSHPQTYISVIEDTFGENITDLVFDKYWNAALETQIFVSKEVYAHGNVYFKFKAS